jgi:hypothetical protein
MEPKGAASFWWRLSRSRKEQLHFVGNGAGAARSSIILVETEPEPQGAASFWWKRSRSGKEQHHFGGNGAATRRGSGSDLDVQRKFLKMSL